jgi:hypothetical protein
MLIAGLLGSIYLRHDDIEPIAIAVDATRRQGRPFGLLRALAHAKRGDASVASEMYQRHVDSGADDDQVAVNLATALMFAGDPRWREALERVLALSADVQVRGVATDLLELAQQINSRHTRDSY